MANDGTAEKLNNLNVKRDIHEFMQDVRKCRRLPPFSHPHLSVLVGYWVPKLRSCRLSFLQDILEDRKDVFKTVDIKLLNTRQNWPEWSVKHAWSLIKDQKELHKYLPVDEMEIADCWPDRDFFWGIACTVLPKWAADYHAAVMKKKHLKMVDQLNSNKKIINVS